MSAGSDKDKGSGAGAVPLPSWRKEAGTDGERFDAWDLMAPGECWFSKVIETDDVVAIVCAGTRSGLARRECLIAAAPTMLDALKAAGEALEEASAAICAWDHHDPAVAAQCNLAYRQICVALAQAQPPAKAGEAKQ